MNTIEKVICLHCHEVIQENKVVISHNVFCCNGCAQVYQILSNSDLCDYYDIDPNAGLKVNSEVRVGKYDYLDKEEHRNQFVKYSDGVKTHVLFSIPQIHCSSCLWLLEKLYKLNEHIISSEVYFEKKEVYIVFEEKDLSLKSLVSILASIGYEPSLSFEVESSSQISYKRREIMKIGISGFCFANIMMLCLPEYFANGSLFSGYFQTAIPFVLLGLSIPVVFYTATEFYISAYKGLRKGILNIDLPVSIAIVITFFRSIFEIVNGTSNGYLDSMSGIVFFMLIGRWLQNKTQNALQFSRDHASYFPIAVERIRNSQVQMVPIHELDVYDQIKVYHNEIIPVDALLSKGEALIDYGFVNGESTPIPVGKGEHIYAGGRQLNGAITLVVMKKHSQSQLTSLWNHYSFSRSKDEVQAKWTDHLGLYFTIVVLGLSAVAGVYWYHMHAYTKMWNAISTVLIVACPCALLLSSNFTYGKILQILSEYKIYIRNYQIIDKLRHISHIVFDKTGTISYADKHHVFYEGKELSLDEKIWAYQLLVHSAHPLAKAICQYLQIHEASDEVSFKEIIGKGVEGWVEDHYIKLGSDEFCQLPINAKSTHVNFLIDGENRGSFYFKNIYRHGLTHLMKKIQSKYSVTILSGDGDSEYQTLRKMINPDNKILFHQSPQQKLEYVESLDLSGQNVLMIGDGLNDAGAFQVSHVSIALTEKNNFFNPASDIIMDADSLPRLSKILHFVSKTKKIITISFIYSILYNVIGLYFALRGELSPVIAAILMPLSSISIILFIFSMSEYYHHKLLKSN